MFGLYAGSKIGLTLNSGIQAAAAVGISFARSFAAQATTTTGPMSWPALFILRGTVDFFARQSSVRESRTVNTSDLLILANTYWPLLVNLPEADGFLSHRGNGTAGTLYITMASQLIDIASGVA